VRGAPAAPAPAQAASAKKPASTARATVVVKKPAPTTRRTAR
jgi:hypothetical protein